MTGLVLSQRNFCLDAGRPAPGPAGGAGAGGTEAGSRVFVVSADALPEGRLDSQKICAEIKTKTPEIAKPCFGHHTGHPDIS